MDPVLMLLFVGMIIFTGALIWVEKAFPNDGQVFQVIASIVAGFTGSFFTRMNPKPSQIDIGPDTTKVTQQTTTTAELKADPPPVVKQP